MTLALGMERFGGSTAATFRGGLFAPEVLDELAGGLHARPEHEPLAPVGSRLERAGRAGAHAHGVERRQLDQVAVELDSPATGENDVDLLGGLVAVGERLALAGLDDEVVHAGLLSTEVAGGKAGFLGGGEAVLGG